jgi:tripeptidyl-peptidase-1
MRTQQASRGEQVEAATVSVSTGNKAVVLKFKVTCGDGSGNIDSVPCSSIGDTPTISAAFSDIEDVFPPNTYTVPGNMVACYDVNNDQCGGTVAAVNCTCMARVGGIEQYRNLRVNVTGTFSDGSSSFYGSSLAFALTDVATASFLYDLYSIPYGIKVQHGSDVAVAEFYGEYYSNADLTTFMQLSGLQNQQISDDNVFGTNDQNSPGGEAQLDVEYLLALAQDAPLTFYSIADLNPYSEENEGFLTWLYIVGNQTDPPLVQSLSYGDIEAAVFNASRPGSSEYGARCDEEFMKMGLRGITVVVSSGDDGLGSFAIRENPTWACAAARPSWPASSPYVTTVGATQLTDQYLPFCEQMYAGGSEPLPVQCSNVAETTCSSTLGGVIVPGGGFSDVYDRATYAPWQLDAVSAYLALDGVTPTTTGYFNTEGRGYPDVAAYGSNYFVYLGGQIVRESGTSASAPVFAAMVALWNDMRFAFNMPPMGFLNPFLYNLGANHPEAFYDVTTGNNACGVGRSIDAVNCCEEYFSASAGWDAVNGWGSPRFDIIANLVLNNQTAFPAQGAILTEEACECTTGENGKNGEDGDNTLAFTALGISIAGAVVGIGALLYVLMMGRTTEEGTSPHNEKLLP